MKKHLLLLTFFIGLLNYAMPSYADNNKILIDTVLKSETSGPRTPEPSIEAYIEDRVITLNIDRFMGSVVTTIDDSSDNSVVTDLQYMSGSTSYTIDVSSLTADTYTLFLTFSDGREYYGIIEMW